SYADDRKSVVGDGSNYEAAHGNRTIAESKVLQNKGYDVFTVGVELAAEQGITKGEAEQLVQQIASSPDKSYVIDDVAKLETSLQNIGKELRSEEHTSELQSRFDLVCRLLLEKKKEDKI